MGHDVKVKLLKPYDFKVGCKDNDGEKVKKIYAKKIEYVVYRTKRSIRIDINDDSPDVSYYCANHLKISASLARLYSWLPEKLSWTESINRQIARAMTTNVAGNYDDAVKMLEHAEERITSLNIIQGRLQYTLSAFASVLLTFIISIFYDNIFCYIALCGTLGGALSVAIGFSSLKIDVDATWLTNCLIGASRILISIAAAIFSYFSIQSDMAFSFIKNMSTNDGIYMIAMVAGFAEMLVPNIMNNLAYESSKNDQRNNLS